jgi:type 1 glutamine amidotransferase
MRTISIFIPSVVLVITAAACGSDSHSAAELNARRSTPGTNGEGIPAVMSVLPEQAQPPERMQQQPAQQQEPPSQTGGTPASEGAPRVTGLEPAAPPASGESADPSTPASGAGDGMPTAGASDPAASDPYAPRSGPFKMLVYSRTLGFRHDSIPQGKTLLQQIATEQGFEITETETNELITPEGLAQFEIVFFMNSTGDIFNDTEQAAFQAWMETKHGAMAGTHSATDTEQGWAFYKEMTGQYYDGHSNANSPGAIQFEAATLQFPAVKGIPNPWQRNEEWYNFNSFQQWSTKPGFIILGRKQADNQPITWAREFGNWRSFYSAIGHDAAVFRDPVVKQHLTGGILWAVRRDL